MREIIHYIDILLVLLAFAYYFGLSIFIYTQNRKSLGNRVISLMFFFLGFWALAIFFNVANPNPEWALLLYRLPPAPALIMGGFMWYFALIYPKEVDLPAWAKAVIFFPILFLGGISIFTDFLIKDFVILDLKYVYLGQRIYGPLYGIYLFFMSLYPLGAASTAGIKALRLAGVERKKTGLVALALFLGALTGLIFGLWLPRLGLLGVYSVGPISVIIGVSLTAYAVLKYQMFVITPRIAAHEILDSLGRSILVCDLRGNILYQGKEDFSLKEEERLKIVDEVIKNGVVRDYRTVVQGLPLAVSARFIAAGGGVVMVFHDITEIEKEEEEEKKLHAQLQKKLEHEKKLRELSSKLAQELKPEEIERFLQSAKESLREYPETFQVIEGMASLTQERSHLLSEIAQEKDALEKRLVEIEGINKASVQRELKMVELKEKIRELKQKKGLA